MLCKGSSLLIRRQGFGYWEESEEVLSLVSFRHPQHLFLWRYTEDLLNFFQRIINKNAFFSTLHEILEAFK